MLLLVLLVGLTFLLGRTPFGRHVYAVGGNAEAARRAGINVKRIKLFCFIICSTLAAVGGILIASRDNSISPTTGGAETLLYAVGAAVIGGTSLFGGKGKILDAVLGGLVIAVIINGMGLLNQPSSVVFMVTGAGAADRGQRGRAVPAAGAVHRPRLTGSAAGADVTGTGVRSRPGRDRPPGPRPSPARSARAPAVTQEEVRRHNLGVLLRLLHVRGPTSRADLTAVSGLNRSTVRALTTELADAGLVREAAPVGRGGAGRPSILVEPRSEHVWALAVDIGVEHLSAARIGLGGVVLDRRQSRLPRGDGARAAGAGPGPGAGRAAARGRRRRRRSASGSRCRAWSAGRTSWSGSRRTSAGWTSRSALLLGAELRSTLPVAVGNEGDLGVMAEHLRGVARGRLRRDLPDRRGRPRRRGHRRRAAARPAPAGTPARSAT